MKKINIEEIKGRYENVERGCDDAENPQDRHLETIAISEILIFEDIPDLINEIERLKRESCRHPKRYCEVCVAEEKKENEN